MCEFCDVPKSMCARCRVKPRAHNMTGCLCVDCEAVVDAMTQAELDADYDARVREHTAVQL